MSLKSMNKDLAVGDYQSALRTGRFGRLLHQAIHP
jgi:hypothetical protein